MRGVFRPDTGAVIRGSYPSKPMDSTTLAETISRDWRHIKAVLERADDHGQAWLDEIDDAEGAFTAPSTRLPGRTAA